MPTNERRINTEQIKETLREILPPGEKVTEQRIDEAAREIQTFVAKALDFGDADHELGKGKRP
jgi:hypothetical protein